MNDADKSGYHLMIVIAIVAATLAMVGVIAVIINSRRRGVPVSFSLALKQGLMKEVPFPRYFSNPLPGLDLFTLWICLSILYGNLPANLRTYLLPGICLAGFIAASVRYAWILRECTELGWNWRIGLRQAWSILIPAMYALYLIGDLRDFPPTYFMQSVCQLVIAGLLTPFFLRSTYIRYQAERAERMRVTYGGYSPSSGN